MGSFFFTVAMRLRRGSSRRQDLDQHDLAVIAVVDAHRTGKAQEAVALVETGDIALLLLNFGSCN